MAIKANLVVDQGTDYETSINLTDADGNIIALSGYTVSSQIRKTFSSSNAVSFSTTLDAGNGIITLNLTDSQTANLVAGRYVYDVIVTTANTTSRIVEGIVTVTPRVTK